MKRLIALLLGCMAATASTAGDWRVCTDISDRGAVEFIDITSVKTTVRGTKRAWFALVSTKTEKAFDLLVDLREIDCENERYRYLQREYCLRGKCDREDLEDRWKYVVPGSAIKGSVQALCAKDPEYLWMYSVPVDSPLDLILAGRFYLEGKIEGKKKRLSQ